MASFRLAVLGTLFSTLGAVVVFALIYAATFHAAEAEFRPIIAAHQDDLVAAMARDKLPMAAEVTRALPHAHHSFYALTDADGRYVAGDTPMPPDPLAWQALTPWQNYRLPAGTLEIDGIGTRLADGSVLFIGEDASAFLRLNKHIAYLFAGVFSVTISLGLLAALLIAFYSLKRVAAISQTSHEIIAGDLTRRVKLYGSDDELDFLTADLNDMLAAMQTLVENARQVTSDIAHDLRSPLTRLHDQLQLARRAAPPPQARDFEDALARLDGVLALFSAILRIAEVEAGAPRGQFTRLDVSETMRFIAESYEAVADDRRQRLLTEIEPGLTLFGDKALFTQMLVNVIENAIAHCPPGTSLRLRAAREGQAMVITMADHGRGIPEADRERVFQRFVRLDAARHSPGHGLGLPLVRAVAALHQGEVSLRDNAPGLIVRIVLPCYITKRQTGGHVQGMHPAA